MMSVNKQHFVNYHIKINIVGDVRLRIDQMDIAYYTDELVLG